MSRKLYPHNKISYLYTYDIQEICSVFKSKGLHEQTVRSWIKKQGLKTIDKKKPTLIYGYDLIEFLRKQNDKGKCSTEFDQIYCFSCKDSRPFYQNKIQIMPKNNSPQVIAHCRTCKTKMYKNYKLEDLPKLKRMFHVVDVWELYDCENPTDKTHIHAHIKTNRSESSQMEMF